MLFVLTYFVIGILSWCVINFLDGLTDIDFDSTGCDWFIPNFIAWPVVWIIVLCCMVFDYLLNVDFEDMKFGLKDRLFDCGRKYKR